MFCNELSQVAEELFGVARFSVPSRVFSEAKREIVVTTMPGIVVSEYRLRPQSSYYAKTAQPVPSPENPNGAHATGIELALSLCRGYLVQQTVCHPCLSIEFSVWGHRERACFGEFFKDHRRLVEKLFAVPKLEFHTACVFDNLDHFRGSGAYKQLDLYYQNENDPEGNFTLERNFGIGTTVAELVGTLLPLVALYDAVYGYCRPKKDKDRILDFISLIHHKI